MCVKHTECNSVLYTVHENSYILYSWNKIIYKLIMGRAHYRGYNHTELTVILFQPKMKNEI